MSVEDRRIETAIGRAVEEIHRLVNGPEDAYKVAMGALLKLLHAYNYTIPAEDVKKLAMRTELNINLSSEKREPVNASTHVDGLVKALLDTLENGNAGLPAGVIDELEKYVIRENTRTTGLLIDTDSNTERYTLDMRGPKVDLTSTVLELADKLRTHNWYVDERAWKQLVCFIPGYRALKKAKKKLGKLKKLFG